MNENEYTEFLRKLWTGELSEKEIEQELEDEAKMLEDYVKEE